MEKINLPKEKRKIKLETVDPTGITMVTYTLPYEVEYVESMITTQLLLTIGEHKYWIKENGALLEKV